MFRMWLKIWENNHLLRDTVYKDDSDTNRTAKIFKGIEDTCMAWDMAKPIWLQSNIKDFKAHSKCRFNHDSFIEKVDFDYFEIQVIEED